MTQAQKKSNYAVRNRMWWSNITVDLKDWNRACLQCQQSKPGVRGSKMPLKQEKIGFDHPTVLILQA